MRKYINSTIKVCEAFMADNESTLTNVDYKRAAIVYAAIMTVLVPVAIYLGLFCSY